MRTNDQPASETSPLTKFSCLVAAAAVTSMGGVLQANGVAVPMVCLSIEPESSSCLVPMDRGKFRAIASTNQFEVSVKEMSDVITSMLAKHRLYPKRTSTTTDGSRLLQFFRNSDVEGGIDIFPNGDVVVIIRKGGVSTVYEASSKDLEKLPVLLMNAGVA